MEWSADEPTAVHLPGSRLNAPRTGPTRSGGLGQLLDFQFLAPLGSTLNITNAHCCRASKPQFLAPLDSFLRVHASFDS